MSSDSTLVDQFLREECTPHVRGLVCQAIKGTDSQQHRARFEFNRFNLSLDLDSRMAVLEDVTDATSAGSVEISFADLVAVLRCDGAAT
jgi:hypothetical protein